uniref:Uncharacterized protein n=1 Tax=Florenciella parvula TaxID=236787 RepID=A0A7S2C4M1_9STRA|mmetsp:Transcript_24130/g.49924  ORF Transcript_24130/g.49924 Transcript_24130/m.49924 type:complete len:217 (+) Transcript_24130:31-681(+)|eukprot:CAMPEP_0182536540 /NCGR_PEP_ID=MMETSP1323-20130603/20234_1 /TAXON_ID=236787 /ORGANISM="Florenciella parvula, Strain RCC1693" /LENGTH=216 /DNA_ID=CAMNT_0024746791 /DNA_START=27 /DNA_END=677 /DNA_ORIENTATION=-
MARISSIILALALMALGVEAFAPRPAVMPRSGVAPLKYSETEAGEATSVISLAALSGGKLSKAKVDAFVAQVNTDTDVIAKARAMKEAEAIAKPTTPKRTANPLFKKRGKISAKKTTVKKSSSAPRTALSLPTAPKRDKVVRTKSVFGAVFEQTTPGAKGTPHTRVAAWSAKRTPLTKKGPKAQGQLRLRSLKPEYTEGMNLSERMTEWQTANFDL